MGGGLLMYLAYKEWRLSATAAGAPEDLTLAALIARGPEGNPFVRVTDFDTGTNFVYQPAKYGSAWDTVWVPATPRTAGAGPDESEDVQKPQVIIKSSHVHSQSELAALVQRPAIEGMVTSRVESLGAEELQHLHNEYPGADISKCLLLEEGRKPSGFTSVFAMGGGGLLLFVLSAAVIVYALTRRRAG